MFLVHGVLASKDLANEPTLTGLYKAWDNAHNKGDKKAHKVPLRKIKVRHLHARSDRDSGESGKIPLKHLRLVEAKRR
jgi:hypothetical protein